MIDMLNRLESKQTKTLIHDIGKIQNVTCDRFYWRFSMILNNSIWINCSTINKENGNNYIYFEEGDIPIDISFLITYMFFSFKKV